MIGQFYLNLLGKVYKFGGFLVLKMEQIAIQKIYEGLEFLKQKMIKIELDVEEINNDLHQVRPEYLKKLRKIKKGKFHGFDNKEDFLDFLDNEI